LALDGFSGNVDPPLVLMPGDLNGDGAQCCMAGYAATARGDWAVDLGGGNEQNGARRCLECCLDGGGVEQAEGDVQGFAETSVVVVVDVPRVHHDADPELAVLSARMQEAGVAAGQKLPENREDEAEQQGLVCRVDQGEQAVAAVGEPGRGGAC
jgi:hypothetical protein